MYDVAIVGTGIAGLSAALTLSLHNKKIIWFGSADLSEKLSRAEKIANYPGFSLVSGGQFASALKKQADDAGLEITEKTITSIYSGDGKLMLAAGNDFYETKSIILATGVASSKELEGESRLLGRGVSYCATCDGFLYKGKKIAAICTSAKLEGEVRYLAQLADEVAYFALYKDVGILPDNVKIVSDIPKQIIGEQRVTAVAGNKATYECEGVFVLKRSYAPTALLPSLETLDGHILVDRQQKTGIAGVFAAGDVTGRPYQYAKAAGEGNVAAHSAIEFLDSQN